MKKIAFALFSLLLISSSCSKKEYRIISPDENLQVMVYLNDEGSIRYNVTLDKNTIIEDSELGLELDNISMSKELKLKDSKTLKRQNETYTMITGKQSEVIDNYSESVLVFENKRKGIMKLIMRAYNSGVAFRYQIDMGDNKAKVLQELSTFKMPQGKAWLMPYDDPAPYKPAYEAYYENEVSTDTQSPTKSGWAFPALFFVNDTWVLLSESDLDEKYCSVHLNSPVDRNYAIRFPEEEEVLGLYPSEPTITGSWHSPWRVIMASKELGGIFENNLSHTLARPSIIKDTNWIKPGIASWSWWWDNDSPEDYNKLKDFVDFGHRMGWKHSLVDAKWHMMKGGSIEQLCEYAKSKDVNIWVWYNSAGKHNNYDLGPRDLLDVAETRRKEFERIAKIGVKGIKVDYVESDKQAIAKLYIDILEDAAEYELMVNFHGCKLPNGWQRTYPHLMTMESVRGAECYKLDPSYPERAAVCNSILPFTRNVIGSMDYTPTTFSSHRYPHTTTNAHELALSIIFESGVQHLADDYCMYENQPEYVLNLLKLLPASWDESHFISGYPGKEVVVARKKNKTWFIAGINSEKCSKKYLLDLSHFSKGLSEIELISDGADHLTFKNETIKFDDKRKIEIDMLPEGGFCAIIK